MVRKKSSQNESELIRALIESSVSMDELVATAESAKKQLRVESELVSVNKPSEVQSNRI